MEKVFRKAFLMSGFHGVVRPQFKNSLRRFIQVLDRNDVKCTFPIVAEVAKRNRDVVKLILDSSHEIATHGLIHVCFKDLPYERQYSMLKGSVEILEELTEAEIEGVRVPYAPSHDENTFKAILNLGLKYDSTLFNPTPTEPKIIIETNGVRLVEFPCLVTETSLVDDLKLSPSELFRVWIEKIGRARGGQFAVVDAHPVRMGTQRYIRVMEELIRYGRENNFEFLNLMEAYEKFKSGKCREKIMVLTGDIDCVSVWDYMRRIWGKA